MRWVGRTSLPYPGPPVPPSWDYVDGCLPIDDNRSKVSMGGRPWWYLSSRCPHLLRRKKPASVSIEDSITSQCGIDRNPASLRTGLSPICISSANKQHFQSRRYSPTSTAPSHCPDIATQGIQVHHLSKTIRQLTSSTFISTTYDPLAAVDCAFCVPRRQVILHELQITA